MIIILIRKLISKFLLKLCKINSKIVLLKFNSQQAPYREFKKRELICWREKIFSSLSREKLVIDLSN
jgi:hypothetical protein